ncbi:MAG: response regulator transcription factor [Gammaproteobacteria bacterium]|nr:response regulator transcription factor [Gammaproteobacteria bacterium]MCP5199657.1 response regulator transcription factor [Gammaproteobacteria bacterium]
MKILVVDDEPLARRRLCSQLAELGYDDIAGEAGDGLEALAAVAARDPDVVLLDVRMPGMDGLETARHLARLAAPPLVVFTTAYDDHALAAFEAQAVDYLLKPIRTERLREALLRAAQLRVGRQALAPATPLPGHRHHVSAVVGGALRLLPVSEVVYFQADQGYVSAVAPGSRLLIEDSLRALEEEFGEQFVRVHRNALVNLAEVKGLERDAAGNTVVVFQRLPDRLLVSRRLLGAVRKVLRGG